MQGQADRVNYLMTKQAKIVAMTCTHAALKRREFLELGFKFDNLLMEESAQILEIETFIPMLLQVTSYYILWLVTIIVLAVLPTSMIRLLFSSAPGQPTVRVAPSA